MPNERNIIVDAIKGLAIILVVIGHTIQYGSHQYFDFFSHPLFMIIYSFHMPLFIYWSGYVAYFSFKNKSEKTIFTSRIGTLLLPFISWGIIEFLLNIFFGNNSLIKLPQYIVALIAFPDRGLWFIWVLFVLYILLIFIRKLEPKLKIGSYIILYLALLFIPYDNFFDIYMIKWLMPFFLAGYLISKYKTYLQRVLPYVKITSLIMFPVLMLFWDKTDYIYLSKMSLSTGLFNTVIDFSYRYTIAAAGIIFAYTLISMLKTTRGNKWLAFIGTYSFEIYSIHMIISHYLPDLPTAASNKVLFNAVYVPLVSIVLIVVSISVSFVIRYNKLLDILLLGNISKWGLFKFKRVTLSTQNNSVKEHHE